MKEVLFDFEEFMDRLDGSRSKVHSAYTRKDSSVYVSYTFRISFLEAPTLVVVYEKTLTAVVYEDDKIAAFQKECRELSKRANATPGYYEEADPVVQ
jgi:hypothetical protein